MVDDGKRARRLWEPFHTLRLGRHEQKQESDQMFHRHGLPKQILRIQDEFQKHAFISVSYGSLSRVWL